MRRAFQILSALLALEVLLQAMFIGYGIAGIDNWVHANKNNALTGTLLDASSPHFTGIGGFELHGMNGTVFIPLIALLLLIVSFFAKVPGGVKRAAILFVMVAVQIVLGISASNVPLLTPLHVLNGFGILAMAGMAARMAAPEKA
jgi:hypothetical protein